VTADDLTPVLDRLDRIEATLRSLVAVRAVKDWYTVDEAAGILGKASYTVREWCRLGRIRAEKQRHARGPHPEWVIADEELARVRREGLLPRA
jgi:transposase